MTTLLKMLQTGFRMIDGDHVNKIAGTVNNLNASQANFTANGTTPVTVADKNVKATSAIIFTLKTVGGTVGAYPTVKTITAGTGFTVACTASDTSVYNYSIVNPT